MTNEMSHKSQLLCAQYHITMCTLYFKSCSYYSNHIQSWTSNLAGVQCCSAQVNFNLIYHVIFKSYILDTLYLHHAFFSIVIQDSLGSFVFLLLSSLRLNFLFLQDLSRKKNIHFDTETC